MNKDRSKSRETEISPRVLAPGQMNMRVAIPVFACFIASVVCSVLNSSFTVRLAGALFLAAMIAIVDWHTWKTGCMRTNWGIIVRSEQPVKFACNAVLFLAVELVLIVGAVVHAVRALS